MSTPETSAMHSKQVSEGSAEFSMPVFTEEQKEKLSVAARIALVLLNPDYRLLRETVYEGTSFTPVIREAVGITRHGETEESQKKPDPAVRAAFQTLQHKGGLSFERHEVLATTTDDDGTEHESFVTAIEIVVNDEKMHAFLGRELSA